MYGLVHYDTPDGDHQPVFEQFVEDALADNGIDIATDVEFTSTWPGAQENARTNISKLREGGRDHHHLYRRPADAPRR